MGIVLGAHVLGVLRRPMVDAVYLKLRRLWPLLVALGRGTFRLFVGGRFDDWHSCPCPLACDGLLAVQGPRLALDARMCKVRTKGIFDVVGVVALDVLPGIARLAVDGISVIVSEATYTPDGVRLLLDNLLLSRDISS
jgi:hypothetical protein